MSLNLTLNNALSGMKLNQQAMTVLSQNMANVNTEGYSRQVMQQSALVIEGVGSGVRLDAITRTVDNYLLRAMQTQSSTVGYTSTISDYSSRVQVMLGQPGAQNSLDEHLTGFFNVLQQLAETPERSSLQSNAANAAEILADEVSNLAFSLEDLRFEADREIAETVRTINGLLSKLDGLNTTIMSSSGIGQSTATLLDQRDQALRELASYMDISTTFNEAGAVTVITNGGIGLVDTSPHMLSYSPLTSAEAFISDNPVNPLRVLTLDKNGQPIGNGYVLVSDGQRGEVTSAISGGKLAGLIETRDSIIPQMLEQLDMLASTMRDAVNAIHNNGSSFPPPNSLTGTRLVSAYDSFDWTGSVRIAVLTTSGDAASSFYADESYTGVRPLTLDLSQLDTGDGPGKPSLQGIIDEINNHFGSPGVKTEVGNLNNIQLVSDTTVLPNGVGNLFTFDFDMENIAADGSTVVIGNITVTDDTAATLDTISPNATYNVAAGEKARTHDPMTLDMSANLTTAYYDVTVDVQVTDSEGNISTSQVTYRIPNAKFDLLNQRYDSSAATGDAVRVIPNTTQDALRAIMVDAEGDELPKENGKYLNQDGYLKLVGGNSNYTVAIDELDSQQLGVIDAVPQIAASNRGFSFFFELNNFFESNQPSDAGDTVRGSAVNLRVEERILDNPSLITTGKLSAETQASNNSDQPLYTYVRQSGDNSAIMSIAGLGTGKLQFAAAGGMPSTLLSLNSYSSEMLGLLSSNASSADANATNAQALYDGYKGRADAISGVNLDEELANTIVFQNAYSATARIVSVVNKMFEDILGMV